MDEKLASIASLSSDLYRIALLSHRESFSMAERFLIEAKRWLKDLEDADVQLYMKKILRSLQTELFVKKLTKDLADNYLMYSILLRNYVMVRM